MAMVFPILRREGDFKQANISLWRLKVYFNELQWFEFGPSNFVNQIWQKQHGRIRSTNDGTNTKVMILL